MARRTAEDGCAGEVSGFVLERRGGSGGCLYIYGIGREGGGSAKILYTRYWKFSGGWKLYTTTYRGLGSCISHLEFAERESTPLLQITSFEISTAFKQASDQACATLPRCELVVVFCDDFNIEHGKSC